MAGSFHSTGPQRTTTACAVIYTRVSSKEQEKEGFSIPAQEKLLRAYAEKEDLKVAREFTDVETAKRSGRTAFSEMLQYLRKQTGRRIILVEKTDRLYRNIRDWVDIDDVDAEIHFVKESVVLSRESRSSEKFMHGIKVLMAKNYVDNLSEESSKGMREKAEQGIWPSRAPLGYRNVQGIDGKKRIELDPDHAPLIAKLFDWYAAGDVSLREATRKAHKAGLIYRKSGGKVPMSAVRTILKNRIYTGGFVWAGKLYAGQHDPIVSLEVWERVQDVFADRQRRKAKKGRRDFAFSGLMTCKNCGCAIVAEIKKERYIYYHCTGYRDKTAGRTESCSRRYVREEALSEQFAELLGQLAFDDAVLDWVRDALHASHADQRREQEAAIERHQAEYNRLQERISAMYVDKLDGLIGQSFFDEKSEEWRRAQRDSQREIDHLQSASSSYYDAGIQLLELAQSAQTLFRRQAPREQRKLLNFLLSNCVWDNGTIEAAFRQPFDLLAKTTVSLAADDAVGKGKSDVSEKWLRE